MSEGTAAPAVQSDTVHLAPVAPPQPFWRRRRVWVLSGAAFVFIAIIITAMILVSAPQPFTVKGTLEVVNSDFGADPCSIAGNEYIVEGAAVTVTDASHKTVALGQLGAGHKDNASLGCSFTFTVNDVPPGPKFYGVEISHRGSVQYTAAQLHDGVALSLG